jgi:hypothetical protein
VSGLFSVLSYLVEQRRREISVRIALGASSRNVTQLILTQTWLPARRVDSRGRHRPSRSDALAQAGLIGFN